jgi:putative heme-binding domain-containing protein
LVAGESRGKIWRVRLVKTPRGYVGKEFLIARLSMLTTDVAISPQGDLYVSCHSGLPDWGTGPNGEGKIFKISYTDPKAPQPVIAWAASPTEVRVAFDKPVDPSITNAVAGRSIEYGEYVRAGDEHEVLKPPYEVVKRQEAAARGRLKVLAARLHEGQTLVLATERHLADAWFTVVIGSVKASGDPRPGETVHLDYDLGGADGRVVQDSLVSRLAETLRDAATASRLEALNQAELLTSWQPHPDLNIVTGLLGAFEDRIRTYPANAEKTAGRFQLLFRLVPPSDADRLRLSAKKPFDLFNATLMQPPCVFTNGEWVLEFSPGQLAARETHLVVENAAVPVSFAYGRKDDTRLRPLPAASFRRFWAPTNAAESSSTFVKAELSAGDYELGHDLFFNDRLKCSTCHRIRGEGGGTGPDLSNLVSRDAASVLRDIKEPSLSINPDYVGYNLTFHNGDELTGFVRNKDAATLAVISVEGKETLVKPPDVKMMRPAGVSLMPSDLLSGLNEEQSRGLLTFLLHEPPKRDEAEIERVLSDPGDRKSEIPNRNLTIVLVASKQDHGPGQHDYPAWQKKWMTLLGQSPGVTATEAWEWPNPEQWRTADVVVFYFWNHDWSAPRYQQLDDFQTRGGGVVVFHSATIADKEPEQLAARLGLAAQPGPTKYRHTPVLLNFVAPTNHAVTRGFKQLNLLDEPYWPMFGDTNRIEVLAAADVDGQARPLVWTFQKGRGRVFASITGHYTWTFDDPLFRVLALRGVAWAAGEPAGRLERLK